jgi:hypothetical protein
MASCILKGASDKTVLLGIRESLTIGFSAGNWLDLRIGMFMSLTDEVSDDLGTNVAGLTESPASTPNYTLSNHYYFGLKDRSAIMPYATGSTFIGYTSLAGGYSARLSSSDIGSGATNSNYWRPNNPGYPARTFLALEGTIVRATTDAVTPLFLHFPQNTTNAGGYAVLIAMRLVRSDIRSNVVTVTVKSVGYSTDLTYSDTPTLDVLHNALDVWTPSVRTIGPFKVTTIPSSMFYYWPFRQSRLRIHSHGFVRAA